MRRYLIAALVVSVVVAAFAGIAAQSNLGHIRGVVKDSAGAALPGVSMRLSRSGATDRMTVTDAKGEFMFRGLAPGRYEVRAALSGYAAATVWSEVQPGRTVALVLPLATAVAAETLPAPAPPAPPAMVDQSAAFARRFDGGVVGGITGGVAGAFESRSWVFRAPAFNTEAYDRINDNQWTEVARKPLSTFSTDVDTASYSNVRRFLNQGQAPPKDAVRIEELVNYFSFNYAEPHGDLPVAVTTAIGPCPWDVRHRLALVGIQARRIDAARIPPRNLVFLIDVSGSMQSQLKLPLVKASLAMLAPNLTGKDRVAIVVYAGNTGLVLPSTSGSDTATIVDALRRLEAGGSTNGGQGLLLAYKVAQEHFITGGVNRVILATDGDFNVGVTDQGSLVRLVEDKRRSGVALSVLGYGMGNVKDSTMEKLADAGDGNYAYIDSLDEAQKVLVEQAGGTLVTVAKDVKLQVEFNPRAVAAYRLIGYENRLLQDQDFNDDKKDAGDMGAGHSVTALYELVPAGQPIDVPSIDPLKYQQTGTLSSAARSGEAMTVKIRYKERDRDQSALVTAVASDDDAGLSPQLGFAAAVAEFGMLLRDSEFKGSSSFRDALALAQQYKGDDPHGHRAEFIRLLGVAEGVTRLQASR